MAPLITTKFGDALPPAPRHAVTAHFGREWDQFDKYGKDPIGFVGSMKSAYPRSRPHPDIQQLVKAVLALDCHAGEKNGSSSRCMLFSSVQSAQECRDYATSDARHNAQQGKKPIPFEQTSIRAFAAKDFFFALFYPADFAGPPASFWATAGVGVSSRFAEANLQHLDRLREIPLGSLTDDIPETTQGRPLFDGLAHQCLRERLVSYLDRAPLNPDDQPRPAAHDVYLFPSGMASIYKPTSYLLKRAQRKSVLFGMAFANTLGLFTDFGGMALFGRPDDNELVNLEHFLAAERREGRKVQAIWLEFPANPLLTTPDITRLRELADEYDTILAIDDTIASVANVDVLSKADLLMTSLTKYFNGNADTIAGSIILNPASPKYRELKALFDSHYVPELYIDDAEVIERNSRDFLVRMAKHNQNADAIARYLESCARDPESVIKHVSYPSLADAQGSEVYRRFMRPPTPDFEPGYGCLLCIEFSGLEATKAFFDNLNLHKGPHFGAPLTLVMPYVAGIYYSKLDWAAENGMRPTQIRFAAGREDTEELLGEVRHAVEVANRVIFSSS